MGSIFLTASEDRLLSDELRDDPLRQEYDPVGEKESNRIRTYYKDMGMAMHPEERAAALKFKKDVNAQAAKQEGALGDYKSDYATSMAAADKEAESILAKAKAKKPKVSAPQQQKVTVNVASFGNHEKSYSVNKDWAEKALAGNASYNNGSYNIDVQGYGKEVHEALIDAQNLTNNADNDQAAMVASAQSAADKAFNMQIQGLEEQIASEKKIATDKYNQDVSIAEQQIAQTKKVYTNWLSKNQKAFAKGVASNDKGISDLLNTGALEFKATVKK